MAFPSIVACQEELLSKSQTVHKESFCLHSQSSRKVAPRSWLHLCALTEQLRAAAMLNRPWALAHCRSKKTAWGTGLMQLLGAFPLVSQSTKTVRLLMVVMSSFLWKLGKWKILVAAYLFCLPEDSSSVCCFLSVPHFGIVSSVYSGFMGWDLF